MEKSWEILLRTWICFAYNTLLCFHSGLPRVPHHLSDPQTRERGPVCSSSGAEVVVTQHGTPVHKDSTLDIFFSVLQSYEDRSHHRAHFQPPAP